jgi:hypothetical protein
VSIFLRRFRHRSLGVRGGNRYESGHHSDDRRDPATADAPADALGRVVVAVDLGFSTGMIVYSRLPMLSSKVTFLVDKEIPAIHSHS